MTSFATKTAGRTGNPPAPAGRRLRIARKQPPVIQPASPRPQRRDCQGRLIAALEAMAGPGASVTQATMRPWCSATFLGAQHFLQLRIEAPDAAERAQALAAALPEAEFDLRGHVVVELAVDAVEQEGDAAAVMTLAALTVEDW